MSTYEFAPTTIALIRHGQTDWNATGRFQGSSDTELNETGRDQAREAANWLAMNCADYDWDAVRYSPLRRAALTGAIIAEQLSIPIGAPLPSLVERDWGVGESLTSEEIFERWPQVFRPDDPPAGRDLIPGVEPLDLMIARGRFALSTLTTQYPGGHVIATAHGTLIRYTLSDVLGDEVGYIPNLGVTLLRTHFDGKRLRVKVIGSSYDMTMPDPDEAATQLLATATI